MNNFQAQFDAPTPHFGTSFFDTEDAYRVKTDLCYAEDYERLFSELARQQEALGEEMRASERFQDAQRKLAYRGEAEP